MIGIGLLVLRIVVGLTVAAHGAQKLFGWFEGPGIRGFSGVLGQLKVRPAAFWAWVAGLAEFLGGLALAVGFLTPLASYAVAGSMLVAIATIHLAKGFWNARGGVEFPLVILASAVALALTGPGSYSVDRWLHIALPEPTVLLAGAVAVIVGVLLALVSRSRAAVAFGKPQTT
jgi:putative oxidoreductase